MTKRPANQPKGTIGHKHGAMANLTVPAELAVPCRHCGAKPGKPCAGPHGITHAARRKAVSA